MTIPRPAGRSVSPAITLIAVCVSCGLLPASLTGTSIALPAISADLHCSLVSVQWIVNAYNLVFASVMLACGALADLVGRRRMFALGLTIFASTTAATGAFSDIVALDLLRGIAGIGAALVLTSASALLAETFQGPAQMKAFGALGSSFGLGLALGPSTSGLLIDWWGWRTVFIVHAIVAALVLLALPRIRESRNPDAAGVDWPGTVTFTGSLFAITLALVEGPQIGYSSTTVLWLLAGAVILLCAFVVVERRRSGAMFDLGLFAQPKFVAICAMPVLLAFGFVCLLVFLPSFFIGVNGMTARQAGLTMLLLTGPVLAFPILSGTVAKIIAPRYLLAVSLLLVAAGAAWLTTLDPHSTVVSLTGPLLVIGSGVGIAFGLLDGAAISSVPPARAGMAAGMFNTMRLTGEAVAIAGMGSVLVSFTKSALSKGINDYPTSGGTAAVANHLVQGETTTAAAAIPGESRSAFVGFATHAYTDAFHTVLWILVGICAVGASVIAAMLRERSTARVPEPVPTRV